MMHGAWLLSEQGQHAEGIAQLEGALDAWQAVGMANHLPEFLAMLAEMQGKAGRPEKGLSILNEVLEIVGRTDERYYEAEVHLLRGELLLASGIGDEPAAEAGFRLAIKVARRHGARMSELRATTSLCRLLQQQGKRDEAHEMLAEIYGWFTEGFDTADLQEAQALLEQLGATARDRTQPGGG